MMEERDRADSAADGALQLGGDARAQALRGGWRIFGSGWWLVRGGVGFGLVEG